MQKESYAIESAPAKKSIWKILIIILILLLFLAIIIVLSFAVYDYITAEKNENNATETNTNQNPSLINPTINNTPDDLTNTTINASRNTTNPSDNPSDILANCISNCTGKQCGDDGCGGSCGTCNASQYCNATGNCVELINCTHDSGCSSVGSFCQDNMPYNCTLGADGCLDRINRSLCESGEACSRGRCITGECDSDSDCISRGPGFICDNNVCSWIPPIGIPKPEFGIEETYRMYDNPDNRNPALNYTQNSEGGFYTHYVDMNSPNCTDTSNPYGSMAKPRLTVPKSLPEGAVIEVHGGVYNYETAGGGKILHYGTGTAQYPIFFRGSSITPPIFGNRMYIYGQYIIVENLILQGTGISIIIPSGYTYNGTLTHMAIRNCNLTGTGIATGVDGLEVGGHIKDNIVIYNNEISYFGCYNCSEENDAMGIAVSTNSHYIWVLDSHVHHNGGDSFQSGHSAPDGSISYVYIGRNEMHDDRENAVDLKNVADVVVSQNKMHGYNQLDIPGLDNTITVSHYGGTAEGPQRVWYLYNEMYNAGTANQVGGSARDDIYFIGNVIHDVGLSLTTWSSRDIYFIGNTLYNISQGVDSTGTSSYAATITNNIFGKLVGTGGFHIRLEYTDYANNAVVNNNLFQDAMESNIECSNCITADPLFIGPENGNFQLQSSSPAIDTGIEDEVYQQFYDLYGIDIRKDIEGRTRPQGGGWDTGAYEYQGGIGGIGGVGETSAQSEKEMPSKSSSIISQVYQFFKGFLTGNTIKEITGYFLK